MSSADLVFRNALIVDGSGSPGFQGDVAVGGGEIIAVGEFDGEGAEEIDAAGRALTPGFIDIHTHFDPQLCWDSLATPSIEHGVTTVVTGNCSLSLAPVHKNGIAKVISMFEVIEDIKKRTFDAAVPFTWETFPEYLDHIREGLGINVSPLIGHSAIRLYVMGEDAQKRAAHPDEIETMCAIVEEAMAAGALGISSSYVDIDENMDPVPSRFAELDEKIALCKAMAKSGRGVWQVVPFFPDPAQQLANIKELGEISRAAGVMCSLQPILSSPDSPNAQESIDALEEERAKGALVYGQVMPRCFDLNMRLSETSMLLYGLPGWKAIMDEPMPGRIASFADPDRRAGLVEEMGKAAGMSAAIALLRVGAVKAETNEPYVGKTLMEIAASEGRSIGDIVLDIALADDLETEFQLTDVLNADKEAVAGLIDHPLCHFGASDAGAHITQFCGTGDTTHLLEYYVQKTGKMTLERAVHRMTGEVAKDWGLADRGLIAVGRPADLVLFDPHTVAVGDTVFRNDFPGEANRYIREGRGYDAVVINGEIVHRDGKYTDARPGRIV
jgi:N-acyl-D-aspartate/D-glutamate deacylase